MFCSIMDKNSLGFVGRAMKDVCLGDISGEGMWFAAFLAVSVVTVFTGFLECDPRMGKALKVLQYSGQYLHSSQSLLSDKEAILKRALEKLDDEENEVDLALAKMK